MGWKTNTPIRRLDGISYWVIEDPEAISDFINTEIRKEWGEDTKSMPKDPASGIWLGTLAKRKWRLEILRTDDISLDSAAMNYVDPKSGYNFAENLAKRRQELRKGLEKYGIVIWPIIVRKDDMQVLDGYCRYTTLSDMGVQRVYVYIGSLY
jgi:hypothetical protein